MSELKGFACAKPFFEGEANMLGKRKKKKTLPALCAVIVAAGSSRRMGGENKLLLPLAGAPVLAHTLSAFEKCAAVRDIVLV